VLRELVPALLVLVLLPEEVFRVQVFRVLSVETPVVPFEVFRVLSPAQEEG